MAAGWDIRITIFPNGRDALWRWEHHATMALRYHKLRLPRWAARHAELAKASREAFLGGAG